MRDNESLTLQEFQKLHGIKRINFDKVHPTDLEEQLGSDNLICPYCENKIEYDAEQIEDILHGTSYQCPYCEKWFYAEGEMEINTWCKPMEDAVIDNRRYIEQMYAHMDMCSEKGLLFPENRYGNVEWEKYYEYAMPLFENMEKTGGED